MLKRIAILGMILFAGFSSADVCSYITQEQAELGAKLLQNNPNFVQYCALCSKKSKIKVHAEKAEARSVGYENYWGVFVNGVNIDLAYSYLDMGDNTGISLAKLSGCEVPNDVPKMINLTDASMPATPEAKQDVQPAAPKAAPQPSKQEVQSEAPQVSQPASKENVQMPAAENEDKSLSDADQLFKKSEYSAALHLYEEMLEGDRSKSDILTPKISKSYYNLGIQTMQKAVSSGNGSKKDCIRAADYLKQTLFLNKIDSEAVEALRIANICKELGIDLPKVQSEIEELKLRD